MGTNPNSIYILPKQLYICSTLTSLRKQSESNTNGEIGEKVKGCKPMNWYPPTVLAVDVSRSLWLECKAMRLLEQGGSPLCWYQGGWAWGQVVVFEDAMCRIGIVDGSIKVAEIEVAAHDATGASWGQWRKGEGALGEDLTCQNSCWGRRLMLRMMQSSHHGRSMRRVCQAHGIVECEGSK